MLRLPAFPAKPSPAARLVACVFVFLCVLGALGEGSGQDVVAQTSVLSGTVVDEEGRALPGANVVVQKEDSTQGTSTDTDGRFEIGNLAPGSAQVAARFVGYQAEERTIMLEAGRTHTLRFALAPAVVAIDEVVVTAQTRRQRLSEVPIAVTALTAADLEENRVSSVEDYAALTPNLTFASTGRRSESDITIRGVSNLGGQSNAYGVYVDGLNVTPSSSDIAINPALLDIERIEILRGPQGTHFGRNAIAGAVNITTAKPHNQVAAAIEGGVERFGTQQGSAMVNLPLADALALRTTGFYEQSDGFIDDIGLANNTNSHAAWGLRSKLRYQPLQRLTIDASVSHSAFDQGYRTMVPSAAVNPALESILEALGEPGGIREGQGAFPANDARISTDADFRSSLSTTTATGRVAYHFDAFSIIAQSGWVESSSATSGEEDNTARDIITGDVEETLTALSQEVRVQSSRDDTATWLVGATYTDDETQFFVNRFFGRDFPLAPFLSAAPPFRFDQTRTRRTTESVGLFGEVGWKLWHERLNALLGVRYTYDYVRSETDGETFALSTNPDNPAFPGTVVERENSGSVSFQDVSPRLALIYRLTESINVFAAVARGYKAGGFKENQVQGDPTFDEETLWNYELGLKSNGWDRRLRLDASLFYMDWSDLQVNSVDVSTGTPIFETQNAAEASSLGAELEARAIPVKGIEVGGSLGILDAAFDSFPAANVEGAERDLSGGPLPRAPDWTASGFLRYDYAFSERLRGFIRGAVAYTGERYEDIAARAPFRVPGHAVVDLSLGLQTDRARVRVYAENAFDNEYFVGIRASSLSLSGLQVSPRPRLFGAELAVTLF